MEDLLQEYQVQYYKISKKIRKLNCELENNNLRTMEYERLKARRDLLLLERWEVLDAISQLPPLTLTSFAKKWGLVTIR